MSDIYTKNSENIYFLNDKNIMTELTATGTNSIPSQKLFRTYIINLSDEIQYISSEVENIELCSISTSATISSLCAELCTAITSNQEFVNKNFVHLSGGDEISGSLTTNTLTVYQAVTETEGDVPETYYTSTKISQNGVNVSVHGKNGTRKIHLSADNSINDILINDVSLSTYISQDVINSTTTLSNELTTILYSELDNLSVETSSCGIGQVIDAIGETKGKIHISTRQLNTDDISNITEFVDEKLTIAIDDISGTVDNKMSAEHRILSNYINERVSITYKVQGSVNTYEELTAKSLEWTIGVPEQEIPAILSSHIGDVYNVRGSSHEDPVISGQNYVWVYKIGNPTIEKWDPIGGFVNFSNYYTKTDVNEITTTLSTNLTSFEDQQINALKSELTVQISGNYNELSTIDLNQQSLIDTVSTDIGKVDTRLTAVEGYVDRLSSTDSINPGIIMTLSNDVSTLYRNMIQNVKFHGHIKSSNVISANCLSGIFVAEEGFLYNGSMYDVSFEGNTQHEISAITLDGVILADGDVLIIHDHTTRETIPVKELKIYDPNTSTDGNVYRFKGGVSLVELTQAIEDMHQRIGGDLSSISCESKDLTNNYILESLYQEKGKIYYTTRTLMANNVSGLSEYISTSISTSLSNLNCKSQPELSSGSTILKSLSQTNGVISYDVRNLSAQDICGIIEVIDVGIEEVPFLSNLTRPVLCGDVLYVVSSDHIDAAYSYISNLSTEGCNMTGIAANKPYVDQISAELHTEIVNKSNIWLSNIISDDSQPTGLSVSSDKMDQLNIVHFVDTETYVKAAATTSLLTLSDLILIEEDQLNAYNQTIINVREPQLSSDAATKDYVDKHSAKIIDVTTDPTLSAIAYATDEQVETGILTSKDIMYTLRAILRSLGGVKREDNI